jgi:hypothetical protein
MLRLDPPFYMVPVQASGTVNGQATFAYSQFLDDAWAETMNAALRAAAEVRFEAFELRR